MTYDALNRVATSVDMWGKRLTFTLDAAGNRTQVQDSDGGTTDSTFDALGRLTNRKYTESAAVTMSVTQVYDAAGRMTEQYRYGPSYSLVARTSMTYDAADRLTNLQHRDGSSNNISNYTYAYDNASRLTSETKNGTTVRLAKRSPALQACNRARNSRADGAPRASGSGGPTMPPELFA